MADKTTGNLELSKPANGEYQDNWDEPLNQNADTIDEHVSAVEDEIIASRGSKSTLADRVNTGMELDGSLKAIPEVIDARVSQNSGRFITLYDKLNFLDDEYRRIRHGETSLVDGLAYLGRESKLNMPISGPVGANNAANFLTSAGSVFTVEGDPLPVVINCGGYVQICRIDKSVDLSGQTAGTKFIYALRDSGGRVVESGTATGITGGTSLDTLNDASAQFQTKKVQVGDILVISSGANADTYVIDSITDENNIVIKGEFNSALGGQTYAVYDMFHPNIQHESARSQDGTKCYLGECEFNGTSITTISTYAYKGEFESDWISIDVETIPTFTQSFNHNLGCLPKDIMIYASQADDDSTLSELLSVANIDTDYSINFDAGTSDATVAPTGAPYMVRGIKARMNRKTIQIGNLKDNIFYKDYDGVIKVAGYLKVIARG